MNYQDRFKWHPWFAWYPVHVGPFSSRLVWLRVIHRCMFDSRGGTYYDYRDPRHES